MKYYLLIVNDCWDDKGKKVTAREVAIHRLERGLWNLYANTPHRKYIEAGDQVIIYLAGQSREGKTFLASAVVKGITDDYKSLKGLYGDPPIAAIMLGDINMFQTCPKISEIKDELDFVPKNNPKWGCVMQRGLKVISEEDYRRIIAAAENSDVSS